MTDIYINTDDIIKKVLTDLLLNTHINVVNESDAKLIITDNEKITSDKPMLLLNRDIALPLKLNNLLQAIKYNVKKSPVAYNNMKMYPNNLTLECNGNEYVLTEKEFGIFIALIENEKLSAKQLLNIVWGYADNVNSNTVATHINRIRNKINDDIIKTDSDNNYFL